MKYFFLAFHAFPGFSGIEFCAFQETVESWKAGSRFQAFHAFLNIRKSQESVEYLFLAVHTFRVGIPCFPRNRGVLESPESWESFLAFRAFLHIGKSQESVAYLFLAFHAFPGFSGWYPMLSKKLRNPGKLRIIPGFPRFFAHRGKPGKRGAFLPGFPGFSRLSQAFGSNIPGFPGDSGILESPESAESLGFPRFPGFPGKRGKPRVSALSWKAKRLLAFLAFPYVQKSVESQEFFRGIPGISWLFFAGDIPIARVDIILFIADRNDWRKITLLMNACCEFFSWLKFLMSKISCT